ncbi:MAG: MAPEG family protein [Erythrobacter sp.]
MQAQMLAPAAVLVAWTIIMLFWMAGTRLPAAAKAGTDIGASVGGRGQDLEGKIADKINWKAHNLTHLHEQPTLFYAVVVIIAMMGASAGDTLAAWIYVGLRIVHSLWQSIVNKVSVRFVLFLASTFALIYLTYRAIALTLLADPGVAPS